VAVALDKFIDQHELDGLAYYYEGQPDSPVRKLATNLIVGNSLLTAAGFPMCGESDLKTCVAMLIMDRLEIGGSFAEFHPVDFAEGSSWSATTAPTTSTSPRAGPCCGAC